MGRRKLLPNINNLLLQLHLPHRNNGGEDNESKEIPEDSSSSSPKEGAHFQHSNVATHHHHQHQHQHHNLHIFTWPSLKRRSSSSSLASNSSEYDNDHDDEIDNDTETEPSTSNRNLLESSRHTNYNDCLDTNSHKSVVSFGNCEIRTYTQVLGDHPCCSEGCPIQLGWSYTSEESIKVDDYERVYHTIDTQGEEGLDSVPMQKYTVLHELRLTPEERRSILILSKQQEYVNANATTPNTNENHENVCRDASGSDENDNCDSGCNSFSSSRDSNMTSTPTPTIPQTDKHHHERELMRECRRLNRCGGWNVNVKASRKRNKRTQEAFFGSPMPTTTTTTTRIPHSNATTPAEL